MFDTASEAVAAEIRAVAAHRNVSLRVLADRLGVSPMWLTRRVRGPVALTVDDVTAICRELDVDPRDVLDRALDAVQQAVAATH